MKAKYTWPLFATFVVLCFWISEFGSGYLSSVVLNILMFTVLAYGWNIISGLTGYISFGQVGFFGIGAYTAAILMNNVNIPWYLAVPLATVVTSLISILLGALMLRLQGIFFALGMFGLAQICSTIALSSQITGGSMGETLMNVGTPQEAGLLMLGAVVVAVLVTHWIKSSTLSLRLAAIKDDEIATQAAGVNTSLMKVIAFCLSAAFAAVAGGIYVWYQGYLDPASAFNGTFELQTVLMVVIGGLGTLWGPLLGSIVIGLLAQLLWAQFPMEEQILLGVLVILLVMFLPNGLSSLMKYVIDRPRRPIWLPANASSEYGDVEWSTRQAGSHAASEVIRIENVRKAFGGVVAVQDVSLTVKEGEILAIVGPNGAGKTSLFNVISGFTTPDSGRIYLGTKNISKLPAYQHARQGIVRTFQISRVFKSLTVWETVLLAALYGRSRKEAISITMKALETVGLEDLHTALAKELPPGKLRLLDIAKAITRKPKVLLLDEAMAGLTESEVESVHRLLDILSKNGCAVIAIEHVLPAILPIAHRVQVLDHGESIAQDTPQNVFRNPVVVNAYLGQVEEVSHASS